MSADPSPHLSTVELSAGGHRWSVRPGESLTIGREPSCTVTIEHPRISRRHAILTSTSHGWLLTDVSRNGIFVDGQQVSRVAVHRTIEVMLGGRDGAPAVQLRIPDGPADPPKPREAVDARRAPTHAPVSAVHQIAAGRIRIGRRPDNDVVLDDLLVSRRHAELWHTGGAWRVVDLSSPNGTYVNGRRVVDAPVGPGNSPRYLLASEKAGLDPGLDLDLDLDLDLSSLHVIGSTCAPLPDGSYRWVRNHVGSTVQLASTSGRTDVVGGFAGSAPNIPVWAGEISAPNLGVALEAWNEEGQPVIGEVGELVVTKPMPSMPLYFWNDPTGERYREAYFSAHPAVWRHGDWMEITEHGSVIISGRSDATLNRHGVRLGSADIYDVVDKLPEVQDSLVVGAELHDRGYWLALFVVPAEDAELTDEVIEQIKTAIRTQASPATCPRRHRCHRPVAHPRRQTARDPRQAAHPGPPARPGGQPRRRRRLRRPDAVHRLRRGPAT